MVFACQKDSFLQEFKTTVVSCESTKVGDKDGFEVILEDTILFPEGGGQVSK
jgi:misacylated tRNA(Ala) deacylase